MKMIKFMLGVAVAVLCIGSAPPACAENYTYRIQWGETGNGDGQFLAPHGIAVDIKSGNVYVSDYGANRIQKFNANGSVLPFKRLPTGAVDGQVRQPAGVAVDAITGNVYVCDQGNHRIQKFDSNGIFIKTWGTVGSRNSEFGPPLSSGKYNG